MLTQRLKQIYQNRFDELTSIWKDKDFFNHPPSTEKSIVLNSNDYLGLCAHPEILEAKAQYLLNSKDPSLMSATIMNQDCVQTDFEKDIADFVGMESAVLCQSGWSANVGLIETVCQKGIPIYIDRIAHMSLWDGAIRANVKITPFRHNDVEDLDSKIEEPGLIIIDTVYSTNGSLCPLKDIAEVARQKDCLLLVDESHSIGTHGLEGRGLVHSNNIHDVTAFITFSLSKAFSGRGGVVCGGKELNRFFRLTANVSIFSSAVHSYEAVGFSKTLEIIKRADWRRNRVHEVAFKLRDGLRQIGYPVDSGTEQIIALEAGAPSLMLKLRDLLAENNILVAPFMAPATAKDRALCRITPTALISDEQIDKVIDVCEMLKPQLNLQNWYRYNET